MESVKNFVFNYPNFIALGAGCIVGLLSDRWKSPWNPLRKLGCTDTPIPPTYELRCMTNENRKCRACIYLNRICPRGVKECSNGILQWIVDLLDSARYTIDAALHLITLGALKDAFVNAHRRGVKIRFISDAAASCCTGSSIPHLRKAGVEVRTAGLEEGIMMHRKSVIVDNKWLLCGSTNWTMQALCGNWDMLVKSDDVRLVTPFAEAFEIEWEVLGTPYPTPT